MARRSLAISQYEQVIREETMTAGFINVFSTVFNRDQPTQTETFGLRETLALCDIRVHISYKVNSRQGQFV